MKITEASLKDVLIVELPVFEDAIGVFFESINSIVWAKQGLPSEFVQDN